MRSSSLEVFDEDTNTWQHMRVNRVDMQWLEGEAELGVLSHGDALRCRDSWP